ncbi:MAG: alanine racemase [Deltaproteobacteria bacterium]|nr:alanine racemase [Deltaproteobacteria bacterium]
MDLTLAQAQDLARRYETPFYVYDIDAMGRRLRTFRDGLDPATVAIYFAIKANPCPGLLAALAEHVDGADISSLGELHLAQDAGIAPSTMSWAGPVKTRDALVAALRAGLSAGIISVESEAELDRLESAARHVDVPAQITLRLNPETVPRAFSMKMGGRPSPFGIPVENIAAPLRKAQESPWIDLAGFHVYAGTQCLDEDAIVDNIQDTLDLCAKLADTYDVTPEIINLGGGFGVAHFADEIPLDVAHLAQRLGEIFTDLPWRRPRLRSTRLILELGRFIAGPAGRYVCRVIEVRESRGKRYVLLDGGMHHLFAATGNLGQLIKRNYQVKNLTAIERRQGGHDPEHEECVYDLAGPLCTPLDSMARGITLPPCEAGDLLAFENTGAYGYSASPLLFLGHDSPAELIRAGDSIVVGRPRGAVSPVT